ncbi:MAG: rod shape-determining protein MreD [Leptospirales bacterium]|nr:rod shape-determining protein MreD [Leptospirales bacterium]
MIFVYVASAILIVMSLIIQGHSSFDVIRTLGVKPDLLFIIIIYLSFNFGSFFGQTCGFIGGLLHDCISLSPLGLLAFPKMALGFVAGMLGREIFKNNLPTIMLLMFIASLAKGIITLMLCYAFSEASVSQVITVILPEAVYNSFLSPIIFILLDKLFAKELESEGNL